MKSRIVLFFLALSITLFSCCRLCSEEETHVHNRNYYLVAEAEETKPPIHTPFFSEEEEPKIAPPESPTFVYLFVKMVVLLAITLGFLYFAAWLAKRIMHRRIYDVGRSGRIQIVEQRVISPKTCIWLVQVGNSQFILAEHTHNIKLLKELPIEK